MHQYRAYLDFMIKLSRIRAWGLSRETAHLLDQTGFPELAAAIRENRNDLLRARSSRPISGLSVLTTNSLSATSSDSKTPISTHSASSRLNTFSPSSENSLLIANGSSNVKPKPNKTHPIPPRPHPLRCSQRLLNKHSRNKPRHFKARRSKHRRNKKLPRRTAILRFKRVKYNLRGIVRLRFFFFLLFFSSVFSNPFN